MNSKNRFGRYCRIGFVILDENNDRIYTRRFEKRWHLAYAKARCVEAGKRIASDERAMWISAEECDEDYL